MGFDWLWVVSRPGHLSAIYVVQAKKLKLDQSQAYSHGKLRYPAGSKYQLNALKEFAGWVGTVPMYCFYNNVDHRTALTHWNCRVQAPPDIRQLGCTLAPLDVVRRIHDGRGPKGFRSIHVSQEALPRRYLFHPACGSSRLDRGIMRRAVASDNPRRSSALEFLLASDADEEGPIDRQDLLHQLDLDELVRQYVFGRFVPVPDKERTGRRITTRRDRVRVT